MLSRSQPKRPRFALDLLRLHVLDLGCEFRLSSACPSTESLYDEKLVLLSAGNDGFALLTIHISILNVSLKSSTHVIPSNLYWASDFSFGLDFNLGTGTVLTRTTKLANGDENGK
ncbi:hypothetical protein DEO72_LG9g644 [Vigna unguiculata]|uniref:Uncharacterized protein n=1 Tax=Vigna unguiculata TaxID=3917 RepID=A0A4D6MZM8_VIGUN|nr:hypothetical protein DEO72_LG9g644 [Vigna unguiculata]